MIHHGSAQSDLVSVIIVNWNGERYIHECLSSLEEQTYPKQEMILVDNGSTDHSLSIVEKNFPRIRVTRLPQNDGFAKANNLGFIQARGEFIALLNNDAIADRHWVEELVKAMKDHPDVAACASKMLQYQNREMIDSAGDGYTRMGFPDKIGSGLRHSDYFNGLRKVISACAGAALYRCSVLKRIGFFDEDLFCYLEDVDLSLRINQSGYQCLYVPTAIVYHLGSGTTGSKINPFTIYWSTRNYFPVMMKNLPFHLILCYFPFIVAFQFYWISACIRRGVFLSYLKGMKDFFRPKAFKKFLKKRRALKKLWHLPEKEFHQRIMESEREILEGICQKRIFQGRSYRHIQLFLRLFHKTVIQTLDHRPQTLKKVVL